MDFKGGVLTLAPLLLLNMVGTLEPFSAFVRTLNYPGYGICFES
jgi:hypothetical protein